MKRALALVAAVAALALGLASEPVRAGDCKPPCYKHPVTGQIICGTPCP